MVRITLDAIVLAVTDETPKVLTTSAVGESALPSGDLDGDDRTLELGLRRVLAAQTGIEVGYAEQLYSFGDIDRSSETEERLLGLAYLTLVHEEQPAAGARWVDIYALLPWEDRRTDRPRGLDAVIETAARGWVESAPAGERSAREERTTVVFGLDSCPWDGVRVLERYELLYELGLLAESGQRQDSLPDSLPMAFDHRRIVATAFGRLRGKLTYRPVVFELLPLTFTLLQLQRLVEAVAGVPLHKQNFRRTVENGRLVEGTGLYASTGGRPAELFQFRSDVVRERPRPGVGTPWDRT